MACAFTVKQVLSIYREHLKRVLSRGASDPKDKDFLKGLLNRDELAGEIANTYFSDPDAKGKGASTFMPGTTIRNEQNLATYRIVAQVLAPKDFEYIGTDPSNGERYYEGNGLVYMEGPGGYRFFDSANNIPSLTIDNKLDGTAKQIPLITEVLNGSYTDYVKGSDVHVPVTQIDMADALDIADAYHKEYKGFLKRLPGVTKAQRKAMRLMERQQEDHYPQEFRDQLVKRLDYAFMFKGSEFRHRVEVIEDAILRRQQGYNWGKVGESVYMLKLLTFRFLADASLTNAMMAMVRKVTFGAQVKDSTEDRRNTVARWVTDMFKAGPNLQLMKNARILAADVAKGGVPFNSMLSVELGTSGIFHGEVRASEYESTGGGVKYLFSELHRRLAQLSSRANNMIDSTTSSFTYEREHYVLSQYAVVEQSRQKWHESPTKGTVTVTDKAIIVTDVDGVEYVYQLDDVKPGDSYYKVKVKTGDAVQTDDVLAEYHLTREGLQRETMKQHFTSGYLSAYKEAVTMFRNAGVFITKTGPNTDHQVNVNSPRFRRAVMDMQRSGRVTERMEVANRIALNDFFKRPIYQGPVDWRKTGRISAADRLAFWDAGIFGVAATATRFLNDKWVQAVNITAASLASVVGKTGIVNPDKVHGGANVVARAIALEMFGFVRGASNFLENMIEFTPYGLLKGAALQAVDKTKLEYEDEQFYQQRMIDAYARGFAGTIITAGIFAIQALAQKLGKCEDVTLTPDDIAQGEGLVICGHKIPAWWTGMAKGNVALWNMMLNAYEGDWKEYASVMAMLSGGEIGSRDMGVLVNQVLMPKSDRELEQGKRGLEDAIIQSTSDVISGMMPMPAGAIKEGTSWFATASEISPKVTTPEFFNRVFDKSKWAFAQSLGVKEMIISVTEPNPVVDYRARPVLNSYLKFSVGDGLKYDAKDEMLNHLKIQGTELWNGRMRNLFNKQEYQEMEVAPRFMTGDEYYTSNVATGKIFDSYLNTSFEELKKLPDAEARQQIVLVLSDLERYSKDAIEELSRDTWGEDEGYTPATVDDYINHMMVNMSKLSLDRSGDQRLYYNTNGRSGKLHKGFYTISDLGEIK